MKIELSKDDIGLIIAAMALSRKNFQEPEVTEVNLLILRFKEARDIS